MQKQFLSTQFTFVVKYLLFKFTSYVRSFQDGMHFIGTLYFYTFKQRDFAIVHFTVIMNLIIEAISQVCRTFGFIFVYTKKNSVNQIRNKNFTYVQNFTKNSRRLARLNTYRILKDKLQLDVLVNNETRKFNVNYQSEKWQKTYSWRIILLLVYTFALCWPSDYGYCCTTNFTCFLI